MLIVSPFHDYYDTAIGFGGVDKSIVYNRQPRAVDVMKDPQEYDELRRVLDINQGSKDLFSSILPNENYVRDTIDCACWQVSVIFCGKLYRGVCFDPFSYYNGIGPDDYYPRVNRIFDDKTYIYSAEDLPKELDPNKLFRRLLGTRKRVNPEEYFGENGSEKWLDWALEKRLVTVYFIDLQHKRDEIFVDHELKEIQFYKVFDAFSAFQEVSMFVGNIARPDRGGVEISDKDQIVEKGFDLKSSFRKPKGDKKPRRK